MTVGARGMTVGAVQGDMRWGRMTVGARGMTVGVTESGAGTTVGG